MKASELRLNDRNPRTIKTEAFKRLCESIKRDPEFMVLRPIVTDDTGLILGGNMRYRACLELGIKDLPGPWVVNASDLTEEQKRRFMLVDNSPAGMAGEWDMDILAADWEMPDLEELGFDPEKLGVPNFEPGTQEEQERLQKEPIVCPECGHTWVP